MSQPTGTEHLEAMLLALAGWRERVMLAAERLQGRDCGCRQEYVASVRRLLAIINDAPGEP